jgi:hypothetical protein
MDSVSRIIQLLVAPVVMISAGGLIALALYNRLSAIVSRSRAFHKERHEAIRELSGHTLDEQTTRETAELRRRVLVLDGQIPRVLRRARLIRTALIWLLSSVLAMLACSLAMGLSLLWPAAAWAALSLFIAGVICAMVCVVLAMRELSRALEPAVLEHIEETGSAA